MMAVGPLDKRVHKTRCQACRRRRIKCEGGRPCLYCTKKKLDCTPQVTNSDASLVFVRQTPVVQGFNGLNIEIQHHNPTLSSSPVQNTTSPFTNHFFTAFLLRNDFAGVSLDLDTITSQFQSTPSLYHASIAVGALDLGNTFTYSTSEKKAARLEALTSYRASVINFQTEIQCTSIKQSDACLWTTFFLGLFELMFDTTGDGWVKHILYGTSKILQLRGPNAHLNGRGRSFFLTVRLFEICRSCFYPEPTFLGEASWTSLMGRMWEGNLIEEWHPKESLLDLLISCSSLGHRMWALLKPNPPRDEILDKALLHLASEGIAIRTALNQWLDSFNDWLSLDAARKEDTRSTLANIYFHAISIYLSGIFDYRHQFNEFLSAALPLEDIQAHVCGIIQSTEVALRTTNLAGILFFFPLRVAGARARFSEQRTAILAMLDRISERSFVVAHAFSDDLRALWNNASS